MSDKLGLSAGRPSQTRKAQALASLAEQGGRQTRVNFYLDDDLHQRLKIQVTQERRNVSEVLRELIQQYVSK